jgi:hypothetical protein
MSTTFRNRRSLAILGLATVLIATTGFAATQSGHHGKRAHGRHDPACNLTIFRQAAFLTEAIGSDFDVTYPITNNDPDNACVSPITVYVSDGADDIAVLSPASTPTSLNLGAGDQTTVTAHYHINDGTCESDICGEYVVNISIGGNDGFQRIDAEDAPLVKSRDDY